MWRCTKQARRQCPMGNNIKRNVHTKKEFYRPWLFLVVLLLSCSSESSKRFYLSAWFHLAIPDKIQTYFAHLFVLRIKNTKFVCSKRRHVRVWGTATRFDHGILEMLPIKQLQPNLNGFLRLTWFIQPLSTITAAAQQECKFELFWNLALNWLMNFQSTN